jgi:hypothetical protein
LGARSAVSANQLGLRLIELYSAPTTKSLIQKAYDYHKDADRAVSQVLDFLRLWGSFHFPQILRALDRIQKHVFAKFGMPSGDYDLYASKVENRFVDPPLVALEEYGIPLEVARKLRPRMVPFDNLDQVLEKLRRLRLEQTNLSGFEREVVRDAQRTL